MIDNPLRRSALADAYLDRARGRVRSATSNHLPSIMSWSRATSREPERTWLACARWTTRRVGELSTTRATMPLNNGYLPRMYLDAR